MYFKQRTKHSLVKSSYYNGTILNPQVIKSS